MLENHLQRNCRKVQVVNYLYVNAQFNLLVVTFSKYVNLQITV